MKSLDDVFEALGSEKYSAEVYVELSCEDKGLDIEMPFPKVEISYDVDVEYRSWGIGDITITPRGETSLDVVVDGERRSITLDLDDAEVDWIEGSVYAPATLSVLVDRDLNVKEITLFCYFIMK